MADPAAGDVVKASDVIRARPKWYWDNASSNLPVSQNAQPIPGISISFTTETDGAEIAIWWNTQAAGTSGTNTSTTVTARPSIAGPSSSAAPVYSSWRDSAATDQGTVGMNWKTALGVAGSYTITLIGTTGANQLIAVYTAMTVMVQEQFS